MPLSQIKKYSDLRYFGNFTVSERREMLQEHEQKVKSDIKQLQRNLKLLQKKIEFYSEMEDKYGTLRRRIAETE